jgi:hypothetical protein
MSLHTIINDKILNTEINWFYFSRSHRKELCNPDQETVNTFRHPGLPSVTAIWCPVPDSHLSERRLALTAAWISIHQRPFIHSWVALQPFVGPWPLLQLHNHFYTVGRTPCTGDQPVARVLPKHRATHTHNNAHSHPCLEWGSNPRSQRASERAKTVYALDLAATVIDNRLSVTAINIIQSVSDNCELAHGPKLCRKFDMDIGLKRPHYLKYTGYYGPWVLPELSLRTLYFAQRVSMSKGKGKVDPVLN